MSQLNPRELDVLNILWKKNEEMTASDIVNEQRGLTQSTVIAVLRKLLSYDLVEIAGITHSGKVLSRTYRPTPGSKDVIMNSFADDYAHFKDVISKSDMCAAILDIDQNPNQLKAEIAKLREILEAYEKKL